MKLGNERGSATAEVAVLLPSIALCLMLLLSLGVLGAQQIRVQQAASVVARELARGEDPEQAENSGVRIAGNEATYRLDRSAGFAIVHVSRDLQLPIGGSITLHGRAQSTLEQP
ncbi:TadE family type IV pilus minor pilin [Glutamicibacter uratoxydans]|uniref:TadE family type IV pilus minor pilin n=1 Tax=Glutamicibacter uratoxydans TaxID=43667 RepID=UPI003D6F747C